MFGAGCWMFGVGCWIGVQYSAFNGQLFNIQHLMVRIQYSYKDQLLDFQISENPGA